MRGLGALLIGAVLLVAGAASAQTDVAVFGSPDDGSLRFRTMVADRTTPFGRKAWCDCDSTCADTASCETTCGAPDSTVLSQNSDPGLVHADGDGTPGCEDTWTTAYTTYHPRVCVTKGDVDACGGDEIRTGNTPAGVPGGDLSTWADTVILVAGQSNAVGNSPETPFFPPERIRERVWGYTNHSSVLRFLRVTDGRIGFAMDPRFSRFSEGPPSERSTPWPWFIKVWAEQNPGQNLVLVQTAVGAQGLHPDACNSSLNPGVVTTLDDGGTAYESGVDRLDELAAAPFNLTSVDAIFWDQGECDSQTSAVTAAEYEAALKNLFDGLVNDSALVSSSTPFHPAFIHDVDAADSDINTGISNAVTDRANFTQGPDRRGNANTAVAWDYPDGVHVGNVDLLGACWREVLAGNASDCSTASP